MTKTKSTKAKDIKREWYLVDVKEKILGRLATKVARLLIGKAKPYFVPYLDCGDFVVVINAKKVRVTGKKEEQKIYTRYSGYPGGLKKETLGHLRERKPEEIIRRAVSGMLPKNKLRKQRLKRLFVYAAGKHPYDKKFKTKDTSLPADATHQALQAGEVAKAKSLLRGGEATTSTPRMVGQSEK